MTPPAVRRLCVVVDVEGYSAHPNLVQLRIQQRLDAVLRAGLAGAAVARRRSERQDRGDGQLLVLPAGVDEARAVPGLLRGLLVALAADTDNPPLRMRVALGQGVVHLAATGYVGRAVVDTCRLVDAGEVRAELRGVPDADLCLIVTDDLYRDVLTQGYSGFPADGFRMVEVHERAKGFSAVAWMRALSAAVLGPETAAVTAAVAAVPLAAASLLATRSVEVYAADDEPDDAGDEADDLDDDLLGPYDDADPDDLV